jgi:hypothetical protein
MTVESKQSNQHLVAAAFAVAAAALIVAFLAYRGSDVGALPRLIGNLGGGSLLGNSIVFSLYGTAAATMILFSWFSMGIIISEFAGLNSGFEKSPALVLAGNVAVGSAIWSLIWFVFGVLGLYSVYTAIACVVIAIFAFTYAFIIVPFRRPQIISDTFSNVLLVVLLTTLSFAFIAALAPPTAKDSLLYHLAVPKAYVEQGGNAFIEGNIASFLALGTEMHSVWAMLLGNLYDTRAGETAAGAVASLFFPLLLLATFGWAREVGVSGRWSLVATLMVASVPSAYHVASSGYVDLSLALYVTLAIYSLTRWWKTQNWGNAILIAIFLGAALSVKVTAVFVIAAFALVILLRARENKDERASERHSDGSGKIVATGFAALLLAGVIASPWYIRTWAATGSPVFPFYMSIWKGEATGWDVERSNLFQTMNSQYGGADVNKLNYLTAPVRVSVAAQPEQPANYDGVLGVAFLIGLPILLWALWKFDPPVEVKIAGGVAGVMYLFWLFSSAQLRYLLPILPALAVAITASAETISGSRDVLNKVWKYSITGASLACIVTSFAWFCQKAPLRVVLGGETRDEYLTRNLDYYHYYQWLNAETPTDARVWLINMRRDTYHIDRPVFSDYLFEDWTLRKMVWETRDVDELRAKAKSLGVSYVLTRHDFLFDYDKSTLVDDKKPRSENEAKLRIAKEFILNKANTIRADEKFSLIKVN